MTYVIEERIKGTTYGVNVIPTDNGKVTMEQLLKIMMLKETASLTCD